VKRNTGGQLRLVQKDPHGLKLRLLLDGNHIKSASVKLELFGS